MTEERRDFGTRAAIVQRVIEGVVQNPSVMLTVEMLQQWLNVPHDAARRILSRLDSSGLVTEVQRGVWARARHRPRVVLAERFQRERRSSAWPCGRQIQQASASNLALAAAQQCKLLASEFSIQGGSFWREMREFRSDGVFLRHVPLRSVSSQLPYAARVISSGDGYRKGDSMATGTIRTLRADKGFGFIKDDTGKEYFFHQSAVYGEGLDNLREGDSVEFDIGEGERTSSRERPALP